MEGKLYIKKFIRDDGETLSFDGEEIYLAENNTLLVRANPATTAVEYTESDGGEMIRQRNATYVQTIKGLIVPKTSTYWDLETQLSLFFKINHTYKIIYVKKDGSMFAISDAWISMGLQIVPVPHETYSEWSIDFTIGNNGWREYMEDESGKEIYANNVVLPLISAASGGEVWESVEGEEISGEGSSIVLDDTKNGATISDLKIKGDTFQQTYSGKNLWGGYTTYARTSSDVNFSTNSDGTITANGTASAGAFSATGQVAYQNGAYITLSAGTYYLSTKESVPSGVTVQIVETTNSATIKDGLGSFTLSETTNIVVRLKVASGTSFLTTTTVYPMIELGAAPTAYEPYVGGTPAPNPDYPQPISVATGSQTVTLSDGVNSQSYIVDLGSVELAKIGTFQDYIYKSGGDWYVHKEIKEILCDGSENWTGENSNAIFTYAITDSVQPETNVISPILSNYYTANTYSDCYNSRVDYGVSLKKSSQAIAVRNKDFTGSSSCKAWFASNNTTFYYALETPTDTKITDNTLIGELEALAGATGYNGQTVITASPSGTNQPAILAVTMQNPTISGEVWDNVGTEWEMGNGGVQTVNIASTQAIYPVWVVEGPCINPKLQNNTTDTIAEFDGTVATGQTLTVDFEAGTAYLDSALVTRYVAGIVSFAPGENMAGFNSDGGATQESTISWNNIIN